MIVLAIDTAGADCAVALYNSETDGLLAKVSEHIGRGHAEKLMAMIETVMTDAGLTLHAVQRIAIVIGPGSFTGIRVGLAAARGLALALGVDCVGVTTLSVLAAAAVENAKTSLEPQNILAAMDAKREEVYAQLFDAQGSALEPPAMLSYQEFTAKAAAQPVLLCGSGAGVIDAARAVEDRFPIDHVARLGAKAKVEGKPAPLYLRGPDAKPQTGYAVERA